jgi:hypothetical protein
MQMQFRVVRLSGWRAVVAVLAGLIGLVAVVALLAVGFVFVVLPGIVIATVAYWFLPKAKVRAMGPAGDPDVIEGIYAAAPDEAESKRLERQTPP